MSELLPCPMCGESLGYVLRDGLTPRWWAVECAACDRPIDVARAMYPRETTPRTDAADIVWNAAAKHAAQLRAEIVEWRDGMQALVLRMETEFPKLEAAKKNIDSKIDDLMSQLAQARQALQEADNLMGHDDAPTEWRSKWARLWPTAQPAAGPSNPPTAASAPAAEP